MDFPFDSRIRPSSWETTIYTRKTRQCTQVCSKLHNMLKLKGHKGTKCPSKGKNIIRSKHMRIYVYRFSRVKPNKTIIVVHVCGIKVLS